MVIIRNSSHNSNKYDKTNKCAKDICYSSDQYQNYEHYEHSFLNLFVSKQI